MNNSTQQKNILHNFLAGMFSVFSMNLTVKNYYNSTEILEYFSKVESIISKLYAKNFKKTLRN